jgi:hypothetical protein
LDPGPDFMGRVTGFGAGFEMGPGVRIATNDELAHRI